MAGRTDHCSEGLMREDGGELTQIKGQQASLPSCGAVSVVALGSHQSPLLSFYAPFTLNDPFPLPKAPPRLCIFKFYL